jgi:hypothetical protein
MKRFNQHWFCRSFEDERARCIDFFEKEGVESKFIDEMKEHTRPSLYLRHGSIVWKPVPVGKSKIGGHQDLPAGYAWPGNAAKDEHYNFLMQLNLAEMHEVWRHGTKQPFPLPTDGLLLFFEPSYNCSTGQVFHVPRQGLVRTKAKHSHAYKEAVITAKMKLSLPQSLRHELEEERNCGTEAYERSKLPSSIKGVKVTVFEKESRDINSFLASRGATRVGATRVAKLGATTQLLALDEELGWDSRRALEDRARTLKVPQVSLRTLKQYYAAPSGEAKVIAEDNPWDYNSVPSLLGWATYVSDDSHEPPSDTRCLLTLDSDSDIGTCFSDAGYQLVMLKAAELAAHDFTKAVSSWDSS